MREAISSAGAAMWQAARQMARRPKFVAIAVLVLSLGIGMSTALFSVAYDVLLRPLAFPQQNRLVVMWKANREDTSHVGELSYPEFKDWERQSKAFSAMAVLPTTDYGYEVDLAGYGEPVELNRMPVSARFFDVLGVRVALGRTFMESDDRLGAEPTVVLSQALWRDQFHSDRSLIGKTIRLSRQGYNVIGVMPAGFDFPAGTQLWTAIGTNPNSARRGATFLQVIGRLRSGESLESAKGEIAAVMARVAAEYPEYSDPEGEVPVVTALPDYIFGNSKAAILMLWAASLLLFAIACFNIVSLLVARTLLREREIAVRASLGATRGRLLRQFIGEGLVLSTAGAIGGWIATIILLLLARAFAPPGIPRFSSVHLNAFSFLFACGVTVILALAFGCAPAFVIAKRDLWAALGENGGRSTVSRRGALLRRAVLVAEATVTMVLLASAAMVVHNFYDLQRVPVGFALRDVLTAQIRTPEMDPEQRNAFYNRLLDRVRSDPGVEAAGAILLRPLEGAIGWDRQYRAMGQTTDDANRNPTANLEVITPGYFSAVGTPLLAGRDFNLEDDGSHSPVMILSASLARRAFGGARQAIGKQIGLARVATPADQDWRTIVGVVADAQYRKMGVTQGDMFLPFLQTGIPIRYIAIRTKTNPVSFAPVLRKDVEAIDPNLVVSKVQPMMELVGRTRTGPRFSMLLFVAFGIFAGLLAGVGVYGLVSDSVVQRRREMGIRMALGAQRRSILAGVTQTEMAAVGLGGAAGFVLSIALGHVYAHVLYGLAGTDYASAAVAFLLLYSVGLASSFAPAIKVIQTSIAQLLTE